MLMLSTEQGGFIARAKALLATERLILAGHAGTGKTTAIAELVADELSSRSIRVCAPTHKAARVLSRKIMNVNARTLHSAFLKGQKKRSVTEKGAIITEWVYFSKARTKSGREALMEMVPTGTLIVVDEASMISDHIERELMYTARVLDAAIIFVGDPNQLPPIVGNWEREQLPEMHNLDFDVPPLFRSPADVILEQIHRQAEGSDILRFATALRLGDPSISLSGDQMRLTGYGKGTPLPKPEVLLRYDQIIAFTKKVGKTVNDAVRAALGFTSPFPEIGERLYGLPSHGEDYKADDKEDGRIINGAEYRATSVSDSLRLVTFGRAAVADKATVKALSSLSAAAREEILEHLKPVAVSEKWRDTDMTEAEFIEMMDAEWRMSIGLAQADEVLASRIAKAEEAAAARGIVASFKIKASPVAYLPIVIRDIDTEVEFETEIKIAVRTEWEDGAMHKEIEWGELIPHYCITAYKAQGSEWDNVLVIDDMSWGWNKHKPGIYFRSLYTAVTRAREHCRVHKVNDAPELIGKS